MIDIILCGSTGAMGKILKEIIENSSTFNLSGEIDENNPISYDLTGDVIIDFSHFSMIPDLLEFIESKKIPAVICTTGIDHTTENRIFEISKSVPIFRSQNMSIGINLLISIAKKAAEALSDSFDIEIVEAHHKKKIDSPSGTADMIAKELNSSLNNKMEFVHGRSGNDTKRGHNEIGIHSIRGGTIVGEHTVIFSGEDEIIRIEHTATSKKIFATGALKAAEHIANKENGLYTMNDII